ncbi:MAG: tetratricopeptide repeat protein [Rhodospirillaceae bacterium]
MARRWRWRWAFRVAMVALMVALMLALPRFEAAAAPLKVQIRASDSGDHARIVFDWPLAEVKYSVAVADGRLRLTFAEPFEATFKPVLDRLPAWFVSASLEPDGRTVAFVLKRRVRVTKDGRSGKSVYFDVAEDKSPAPPVPPPAAPATTPAKPPAAVVAKGPPLSAPAPGPATAPGSATGPAPAALVPAALVPAALVPAALVFDPGQPAAAAVYTRSDQMYIVFDRALAIGAGVVAGSASGLVGSIQPVLATGGSAFRVTMRPWLRPVVEREGTVWRVVFVPKVQPMRTELTVEAQPDFPLGGRVLIKASDASSVVELTDPEVGDRLMVVPLPVAVQAVSLVHRFPEVELLSALQGVVIRPYGDGVSVRPVRDGVEVTASGGLHLSPSDDTLLARPFGGPGGESVLAALGTGQAGRGEGDHVLPVVSGGEHRLFDIPGWQTSAGKDFTKHRQEHMLAVADATPAERNKARLELARFFFSSGFSEEAIGVLDVLVAAQPDVLGWPEFRALRGAAHVAAGEAHEGLADLSGPGLDENREAALWRAYALVNLRENFPQAVHDFYLADDIMASYPAPFFRRISLAAIDARIQTDDPREAERLLKRLNRRSGPDAETLPANEFFRGEILRENGKIDDAIKHLRAAENSGDRYYRARAGLTRVNMEFKEKRIMAATAADRLSRLRFAWRGDDLELDIIRRHGEMLWEAGEYADGLNTLREAAGYFPDSPQAPVIIQSMSQLFGALYKDGASTLPAVKSIELYDQFRELTPVGTAGDEVIRQLANRLVEVDLLNRAAELLQHQVDYRLSGLEKATVGTKLASIRLLDEKPDLALKALDASEFDQLPPDDVVKRRVLRASALAKLQRSSEALALLEGDSSEPAYMLRVDIAWHDQRWDAAAAALDKLVGGPPAAGVALDKLVRQRVLNRAIALALATDTDGLANLRSKFAAAMAKTEEADAFMVLTRTEQGGGLLDLASIKSRVAEVDVFQSFLKQMNQPTKVN